MPAVSGSTTQQSTSCSTVAELESIEIDQFKQGDLANVSGPGVPGVSVYVLSLVSVAARNGTTILYTRNSNPAIAGLPAGATPGRWALTNIVTPAL